MQQHPRYSFDILNNNREISAVIKQAVLFHHENQNGSGYPFGKTGKEMSVICRIIHAVDVYDALTSKRPYKDPFAPADAYKYLNDGRDILFDSEVISAMTQVIPAYPPGIEVKLSSGESALVLAHTADAFRPKVKILDTGKIINMYEDEEYEDIIITESSIMPSDYVSDIEGLNEDRSAVRKVTKDTVMIVDDTKLSLIHTKAALDDKYNVLTFANPLDAINYFKENKAPDLVIMDIEMPFINGIDAVKHIRKLGGQKTPVIFFTGTRDAGTVLKCREVGAIDYIVKPSTAIYIQQRVAEALGESLD